MFKPDFAFRVIFLCLIKAPFGDYLDFFSRLKQIQA